MDKNSIKYIDFTTVKEDFNTYKTENGLYLRVKQILTTIRYDPNNKNEKGEYQYEFGTQTVSHVEKHELIDTDSLEIDEPNKVTAEDEIDMLNFEPIKESINIYESDKFFIFLILEVSQIKSTNKKDRTETPIIRFESKVTMKIENKKPK
ncbi:MAG: hypothetical protein KC483_10425 [Nitrosarchaeum sp.]|nr:hypothetical protein [Nitrosarchaeum sp.]